MKSIEAKSKEYANSKLRYTDDKRLTDFDKLKSAFESGVEFAQRWIHVEEELPKSNIVDALNFFLCIVPISDYPIVCKFLPTTKEWYVPYNVTIVKPTFWRQIYFS